MADGGVHMIGKRRNIRRRHGTGKQQAVKQAAQAGDGIVEHRDLSLGSCCCCCFEEPTGTRLIPRSGFFHRQKYHAPMPACGKYPDGMTAGGHQIEFGMRQGDAGKDAAKHHGRDGRGGEPFLHGEG